MNTVIVSKIEKKSRGLAFEWLMDYQFLHRLLPLQKPIVLFSSGIIQIREN